MIKIKTFTLIELLIVVAIIGILAAVGTPIYNGFIKSTKETTAKNSLRSIGLVEADYFSENNQYLTIGVNTTANININLFKGKKTLNEDSDSGGYTYIIVDTADIGTAPKYRATAIPSEGSGLTQYCVDQTEGPPTSCD